MDGVSASSLASANAARAGNRAARMEALRALVEAEPAAGPAGWARALGCSRTTVYSYLEELRGRNGDGEDVALG